MNARLSAWYRALSRREQWLVAVAGALAVVTFAWASVILVLAAMNSAHSRLNDAVRRMAETEARVKDVADLTRDPVVPPNSPVDAVIRDRAQAAGFTLSANDPQADGSVAIAIASARPAALFPWVAGLEREGLVVQRLVASDNGNHTVAVQMTLKKMRS